MRLVVVESPLHPRPYTGVWRWLPLVRRWVEARRYERNRQYARACMRDCLRRGEAPYASHLLFDQPGILDDRKLAERELGMQAGFAWGAAAVHVALYGDYGVSSGMLRGQARAVAAGTETSLRFLGPRWWAR